MKATPIAIAIVCLTAGAYGWVKLHGGKAPAQTKYTIALASVGSAKRTVSSSGTLKAWTTVDVKSKAGGRIDLLAVDVGSRVKKGQILAKIDPADSLLTYNQARANTEAAKVKEAQNARTYHLTVAQADISVAQARANLASAKASLQQAEARLQTARTESGVQPSLTEAAIGQAKAAYDSAVQARSKLTATQAQELASAKATYDQAVANDLNAQANLTRQNALLAKGFVSQSTVDSAVANAGVTKANVESAKSKLDTIGAQQQAERDSADASVRQAEANWKSAQAGSYVVRTKRDSQNENVAAVQQAKAAVETAQAQLNDAVAAEQNGPIRKLDIDSARTSIESAQAQLDNAKITLDQTTVTAPGDGVVLQKYVEQGTIITSGLSLNSSGTSIVQIGDVSRKYVDVSVDETDIASIRMGARVDVAFDAFPNRTFSGTVIKINPLGVVEQNVTTIHVRVEIDNHAQGFADLKPEMNATCEFIQESAEDVLTVPSAAVHKDGDSAYVEVATGGVPAASSLPDLTNLPAGPPAGGFPGGGVPGGPPPGMATGTPPAGVKPPKGLQLVLTDAKIERRPVTVGVEGNDAIEVKSGLKEGEQVVISTEVAQSDDLPKGGAAFGGGMPGMGGGRR